MGFENFETVFGEPKAEWGRSSDPGSVPLRRFLMHVFAPDYYHLKFLVTDFHYHTFEALMSVLQLEDLRDAVGIGGSWSEFVDYTIASIKQDVKIVLEKGSNSGGEANAKLVAQKSKGMPLISISLTKLSDSAAQDAIENMSFGLFKALKFMQNVEAQEQEHSSDLTKEMLSEKEKRQRLSEMDFSKKADVFPLAASSASKDSPDKQAAQGAPLAKATSRVVPAFRRAKIRGAVLQDSDDEKDE